MSRHFEKTIADAQAVVAEVGKPAPRSEPMLTREIESFVKGFGLSAKATQQIVDQWVADAAQNYRSGYDSGYDFAAE